MIAWKGNLSSEVRIREALLSQFNTDLEKWLVFVVSMCLNARAAAARVLVQMTKIKNSKLLGHRIGTVPIL